MSSALSPQPVKPRPWVVSPAWDLAYLVLTPVLIVPAVLIAARRWLAPEQIYLAVIAFASLGHHLPGFMRAYGDQELFARYRWRFVLAPPLVFVLALLFTPPRGMAQTLGLPWTHLHGLELILLVWGTWHGLMQTYGFMRIYDLRRGENDRATGRLDHALCVAMFTAGVVFSDTRMFGVANAMWQSGLPQFNRDALIALRWLVGLASSVVLLLYAYHLVRRWRNAHAVNGVKLVLAATTGWFYWYCGRLSTNVLIGIAMFEIYHAVQYNAIVWIYNRRLFDRAGERFGLLGFMFRDRKSMLGLYLAAIAAYSSIRFFTSHAGDRMFSGDLDNARQWLIAAFVTSSILHFYYDGFIWKVSERKTRENLVDDSSLPVVDRLAPSMVHAGKWLALIGVALVLVAAERSREAFRSDTEGLTNRRMLTALAELTPDVPEAKSIKDQLTLIDADQQYESGLAALMRGDAVAAVGPLLKAVELNPAHVHAYIQLGDAYLALHNPAASEVVYRKAAELAPESSDAVVGLAEAQIKSGRLDVAEQTLRTALEDRPDSAEVAFALGYFLQQTGRLQEGERLLRRAAESGLSRRSP